MIRIILSILITTTLIIASACDFRKSAAQWEEDDDDYALFIKQLNEGKSNVYKHRYLNGDVFVRTLVPLNELYIFVDDAKSGKFLFRLQVDPKKKKLKNIYKNHESAEILNFERSSLVIKPDDSDQWMYLGWATDESSDFLGTIDVSFRAHGYGLSRHNWWCNIDPHHEMWRVLQREPDTYDTLCDYYDAEGGDVACNGAGGDYATDCSYQYSSGACSTGCSGGAIACCGQYPESASNTLFQGWVIHYEDDCKCCL